MKFPLIVVLAVASAFVAPLQAQSCAQGVSPNAALAREEADSRALRILAGASGLSNTYDLCRRLGEAIELTRSVATARMVFDLAAGLRGDFELAEILIAAAGRGLLDERTSEGFFAAARRIEDDFQLRRALSAAIPRAASSPQVLQALLRASGGIADDYQLASLLIDVVRATPRAATERDRFLAAASALQNEWEYRRVTNALAARDGASR